MTQKLTAHWPEGISDGLVSPCAICGAHVAFDYTVSDALWQRVVPERWRRGVVCLPCLDALACEHGEPLAPALKRVQFVGTGYTVVFKPERVVYHANQDAPTEDAS